MTMLKALVDEGDGENQVACEELEDVGNKTGSVDAKVAGDKGVQVVDVDDKVAGVYSEKVVGVEVVDVDGVDNEVPSTASSNFAGEVDHLR